MSWASPRISSAMGSFALAYLGALLLALGSMLAILAMLREITPVAVWLSVGLIVSVVALWPMKVGADNARRHLGVGAGTGTQSSTGPEAQPAQHSPSRKLTSDQRAARQKLAKIAWVFGIVLLVFNVLLAIPVLGGDFSTMPAVIPGLLMGGILVALGRRR